MRYLLFNGEGRRTSGVATFCLRMVEADPAFHVVSLDIDESEEPKAREVVISSNDSHDAIAIANIVFKFIEADAGLLGDWVLIPNVGAVCYDACIRLRNKLLERGFPAVAIVAICHSDDPNQYKVLDYYKATIDGALFVSRRIGSRIEQYMPDLMPDQLSQLRIPLPIDFPRRSRRRIRSPLTLAYSGRLDFQQKRIDRLVELADRLLARGLQFRLLVIGDGRDRAIFEGQMDKLSRLYAWSGCSILGPLPFSELFAKLADADIALLTSEYEGAPLAIIEAMGLGLCPVVMDMDSWAGSELAEYLVIVPQGSVEAMSDAVLELDADRGRLAFVGRVASRFVREQYSVNSSIAQISAVAVVALERSAKRGRTMFSHFGYGHGRVGSLADLALAKLSSRNCRFGVFGVGMFGRLLIDRLIGEGTIPVVLADSDPRKVGGSFRSIAIWDPEHLVEAGLDTVLIASDAFVDEMRARLLDAYRFRNRLPPKILAVDDLECS